jgi:hypothetical protein
MQEAKWIQASYLSHANRVEKIYLTLPGSCGDVDASLLGYCTRAPLACWIENGNLKSQGSKLRSNKKK